MFKKLNLQYFADSNDMKLETDGNIRVTNDGGEVKGQYQDKRAESTVKDGDAAQQQEDQQKDKGGEATEKKDDKQDSGLSEDEKKRIAEGELLQKLGYSDTEKLQNDLKAWQKFQEDQKTETEKQQEKLTKYEQSVAEKEETISTLEAKVAAMSEGVNAESMDDVIILARERAKQNKDLDVSAAIKQVIEVHPHFAGEQKKQQDKKPKFTNTQNRQSNETEDSFIKSLGVK